MSTKYPGKLPNRLIATLAPLISVNMSEQEQKNSELSPDEEKSTLEVTLSQSGGVDKTESGTKTAVTIKEN